VSYFWVTTRGGGISGCAAWAATKSASLKGLGDSDGDGVRALHEYVLGTNPNAPSGNFPTGAGQSLVFRFPIPSGTPGQQYMRIKATLP